MSIKLIEHLGRELQLHSDEIRLRKEKVKHLRQRIRDLKVQYFTPTMTYDPMAIVVPAEVDQAARVVEDWFWHQGHKKWSYKGIQSRRDDPKTEPECIVKGCVNTREGGKFCNDLCFSCYSMLTTGKLGPSESFLGKIYRYMSAHGVTTL